MSGVPQRIYLSRDVPVREEGWTDPDFVPRLSPWRRTVRNVRYLLFRMRNFRILEILAVLLILGGVLYFLNGDAKDDQTKRRGVFFR